MENLPAIRPNMAPGMPTETEFSMLQTMARNAAACGLYKGIGSEPQIFMILLAARELGVPPMQALNGGIWNIQGKIEISARLMNAMIRRAGHSIVVEHCDETKCVMKGRRADSGDTFTAQFSMEDAKRAGLAGRGSWKSYAEDMLYARAMSRLARRLFPDIIGTAYVEGEIRDAKCEVITPIKEEEPEEDAEEAMFRFLQGQPEGEHDLIKAFIQAHADHYKISLTKALAHYSTGDNFAKFFPTWKMRQQAKTA